MKKNTMKKLTALACAGAMSLSLAACGNGGNSDPPLPARPAARKA